MSTALKCMAGYDSWGRIWHSLAHHILTQLELPCNPCVLIIVQSCLVHTVILGHQMMHGAGCSSVLRMHWLCRTFNGAQSFHSPINFRSLRILHACGSKSKSSKICCLRHISNDPRNTTSGKLYMCIWSDSLTICALHLACWWTQAEYLCL